MSKLAAGEKMPDFSYESPFEKNARFADAVARVPGKTALIFLRYFGCTLCQFQIHDYLTHYEDIASTGGQVLVVLQSDPQLVYNDIKDVDFPFEIVCDPTQSLYKRFGLDSAPDKKTMLGENGVEFVASLKAQGFKHGKYEGNELQLPATFIVDHDLTITFVHYGKTGPDVPSSAEVVKLLS